jgi:hypothetical protein
MKRHSNSCEDNAVDVGDDLRITHVSRRPSDRGTWISGTLRDCKFSALVFPEHALNRAWEIGDSRISKLSIQRRSDDTLLYCWDRGLDQPAAEPWVQEVVEFLAEGLADFVYPAAVDKDAPAKERT